MRIILLLAAALLPAALAGCSAIETDALLARRLPGPPLETDWRDAVPLRLQVNGGRVHRTVRRVTAQEVDQDTVHRNSASCHHGPSLAESVPVWMRAYYDDRNLYLRLSWPDATPDTTPRRWKATGDGWRVEEGGGDGMALLFPRTVAGTFTCALACHLDDWRMAGGRFQESARMRFADPGSEADLILWRGEERGAQDLVLTGTGMHPRGTEIPLRRENSVQAERAAADPQAREMVFLPGDEPLVDDRGRPPARPPAPGTTAPAYLSLSATGGGSTIAAVGEHREGRWQVTVTRPLQPDAGNAVRFLPGGTYPFGLSLMDDTVRDHHIVERAWRLQLIS